MLPIFVLAHAGEAGGNWFPLTLPPAHPILVNFTAALVPISLAADLSGRLSRRKSLLDTGWWTLLAAVLVTPLTVAAGWYWLRQMQDMDHPQMPVHKWLGTAMAILLPLLLWARWRSYRSGANPGWLYLSCTFLVVAALVVQGHLGGTMSFGSDEDAPAGPSATSTSTMAADMDMHDAHAARHSTSAQPTTSPSPPIWKNHLDLPG